MKIKLQTMLRHKLQWLLLLAALLGVSQGVWANFNAKQTWYFDNSKTNWSNVYIIIGRSDWTQAVKLTTTDCNGYYVHSETGWDNVYELFFADSACGYSTGSGSAKDVDSSRSGNYTANVRSLPSNFVCSPNSSSGTSIGITWNAYSTLKCVLTGSKIMFYIGEQTSWNQSTFYLTKNSAIVATTNSSETVTYDSKKYGIVTASATTGYYVTHDGSLSYAGHQISGTPVQGGAYWNSDNSTCTAAVSTAKTATVTLGSSSITEGSNVSYTSTKSSGGLGLTSSIKFYATTDNSTFTELSTSSGNLVTSGLPTGTYTIWPVYYDGHIYCRGTSASLTIMSSCNTVTSTSVGGASTQTLTNGASEAITSNTTYSGTITPSGAGDTYLWTVSPSPFSGATTIGTSTATSTTIRFRREGQYSVKFAAGCSSASVESSAYTVNVYPGSLYVAGPLFKGSGVWNQTETMSKSGSGTSAVYTKDLTVAYAGGEFTFQSVTNAGQSNYILPHYSTTAGGSTYTNITRSGSGNNNLTSSFTLANGDNVQVKVAYRGANASGEPKYDFSLCRYPTADGFTMNRTSATYTGSSLTVTVSPKSGYGTVSNIKYAGTTNAGATYSKSSTGPTEAGTYTVYADIAANGTWCAKEQLEIGTFTINRADQATLTVSNSTTSRCYGNTFTLTSSGGSGDGAVTFAIVSGGTGTGSITGTTLSASAAGTILVQATKAASANFNEATSATKTFTFNPKPTKGSISGNTSACSGVTGGVSLTLSGHTTTGTSIQWKKKATSESSYTEIAGATGTALSTSQTEQTTYRAYVKYTATGCSNYAYKTVSITPDASIGSVTLSSSSVCIGQGLSATANDVVPGGGTGAWSSSNPSVATIAPNGNITPVGAGSTNIIYTITGGCGGTVSAYATLTVKPNAAAAQYTLSNNTQTYNGAPRSVTVTPATGAGTATVYYSSASYAKSTTGPINAGTYTVTVDAAAGTNYCAASDINVGTLTINKANQSTLTISNTLTTFAYCSGAHTTLTTSGGSGDGAITYTITSGSGTIDGSTLTATAKNSITVTATKAASQNYNATTSAGKTFNFTQATPTAYTLSNVGDATTICGDPSTGAGSGTLRLANSQTGYNYQLYSNGSPVEGYAAKAGTTGSSIDFPVTSSGTYTVYAYYGTNSTNCATQMDGEITLTISTQPKLVRSAASVTEYMPVTITSVSTDIAEWKIVDGSGNDVSSSTAYLFDQTYDAITFKGASTDASTPKTYTIKATTAGGCSATTTITVNPDTESCS